MKSNIRKLYTHGHATAVVQSHALRTCEDFAPQMVQLLRLGDSVLDVGCGPGSITKGFRKYIGNLGRIVGIDVSKQVLEEAKQICKGENCEIELGDVYNLKYKENEFDIIHAHQVLQHLTDPIQALKEMKRVSKQIVTCRDADYESWLWYPPSKGIQSWKEAYRKTCRKNETEPDAGKKLKSWFIKADFDPNLLTVTCNTVTDSNPTRTKLISESWAKRVNETQVGDQMVKYGFASRQQVEEMARDWKEWGLKEDAIMFHVDVTVVARKS